jgi:hypothetical protein
MGWGIILAGQILAGGTKFGHFLLIGGTSFGRSRRHKYSEMEGKNFSIILSKNSQKIEGVDKLWR